ncbi:MAG: GAF domain-containing protein [Acidimicrobiales bacterium]
MAEKTVVEAGPKDELPPFGLSTRYSLHQVVVAVRGEVDLLTAPALAGLTGALVEDGDVDVVLDLDGLDFLGAAGLGVIAGLVARLDLAGRALTIRSPSSQVRRILDMVRMASLVEADPPPMSERLGGEQRSGDFSADVVVGPAPAETVVAWLPARSLTDLIDAALRLVTALTRATVGGADGVSVSLTRHGRLTTVAASDETITQMDRDQYSTGEGPCLAAAAEGHWFHVESLAEETRWPHFIPRAVAGGIGSILSTPLIVADRPVGALNIYSTTAGAFGPHDQELAALFASHASTILAEAHVDTTADEAARDLREALRTRETIAQAQGIIMGQRGISAEAASASMRQSSKRTGERVRDRAAAIILSAVPPSSTTDR